MSIHLFFRIFSFSQRISTSPIFLPVYLTVFLQLLQVGTERLERYALDVALHLVEAYRPELHQSVKDEHLVLPVDEGQGVAEPGLIYVRIHYAALDHRHTTCRYIMQVQKPSTLHFVKCPLEPETSLQVSTWSAGKCLKRAKVPDLYPSERCSSFSDRVAGVM